MKKIGINNKDWPCKYAEKEWEEIRFCCGNKKEELHLVQCGLYNENVEKNYCMSACTRQEKIHVAICAPQGGPGQGIGDTLQGLWAIWGLKEKYPDREVVYYTTNQEIAQLSYTNSKHVSKAQDNIHTNLNDDYDSRLRSKESFVDYYCQKLDCTPKKPEISFDRTRQFHDGNYVLLFPFAAWNQRSWPITYYLRLEDRLSDMGLNVVICGVKRDEWAFKNFSNRATYYCNLNMQDLCNLVWFSDLVISNDSMPAHLCGITETPCIAIHTHLSEYALYKYYTSVTSITNSDCNSCHWDESKHKNYCMSKCWSLKAISPEIVLQEVLRKLEDGKTAKRSGFADCERREAEICNAPFPV